MSQAQNVQVQPELKLTEGPSAMKSHMLWIGILALFLIAILAFGTVSANQDLGVSSSGAGRAINPELSAAQRYAESNREALEHDDLAINPELKSVSNRPPAAMTEPSSSDWAINPELYFAQRYAEAASLVRERENIWAANPELSAANRFAEASAESSEAADLYRNPELKLVVGKDTAEAYGDDFFRANPEVATHRRFAAGLGH